MSKQPSTKTYLCINRCVKHGFWSVTVDNIRPDGSGNGTRVTPSKCCGAWDTVRKFDLSSYEWKQLAALAKEAGKQ